MKENFHSDLPKISIGGNQITNEVFSPRISKHKMWIWSTNVQTRKYWLTNIRHFQATDTSMLVSIGAHNFTRFCCQFYHSHHKINKIELDSIAYSVVINLSLHVAMKFSNHTVRKIRFIMAGCRKYRQSVWNILDIYPQYWWAV